MTRVIDQWLELAELSELFGLNEESNRATRQKSSFSAATVDTLCEAGSHRIRVFTLVESSTACGTGCACQPGLSITQYLGAQTPPLNSKIYVDFARFSR